MDGRQVWTRAIFVMTMGIAAPHQGVCHASLQQGSELQQTLSQGKRAYAFAVTGWLQQGIDV